MDSSKRTMTKDTLDMRYVDLGVLEQKMKQLFNEDYEIEDLSDKYLLTIPRKLKQEEKDEIQEETNRRCKANKGA